MGTWLVGTVLVPGHAQLPAAGCSRCCHSCSRGRQHRPPAAQHRQQHTGECHRRRLASARLAAAVQSWLRGQRWALRRRLRDGARRGLRQSSLRRDRLLGGRAQLQLSITWWLCVPRPGEGLDRLGAGRAHGRARWAVGGGPGARDRARPHRGAENAHLHDRWHG